MTSFSEAYAATDDPNEKYQLLRRELTRLRGRASEDDFFDPEAVGRDIRRSNATVDGDLVVFVANDFGLPMAYCPRGLGRDVRAEIRREILRNKYDAHEELNDVRRELLREHPGVHKAIVAEHVSGDVRYHLPEGSNEATNFLTVREMVGLVDYTTNSSQSDGLTYRY